MITASQFRRGALSTWSVKPAKRGVRIMGSRKHDLNVGHAIVGLSTEVGEVLQVAQGFLLGLNNLSDIQEDLIDELSDVTYYAVVAAKFLKIKTPPVKRRVRNPLPAATVLLVMQGMATDLLSAYKKMYYGKEMDMGLISYILVQLIDVLWEASWSLLDKPIVEVMQFNNEKLLTGPNARFPNGSFEVEAINAKEESE